VHQVREQDKTLLNMKRALDNSSALQVASMQEMRKVVRQHSVEKNDTIQDAKKAKVELAVVVKKTDRLITRLERDVQDLAQGKVAMAAHVEERVEAIDQQARAMAKDQRQLELNQAEYVEQKVIQDKQLASLAYQRDLTLTERRKIKKTHWKALEHVKCTSAQDKEVSYFASPPSVL
jgi:hypothetical protein